MAANLKEIILNRQSGINNPGFHDAHIKARKIRGDPELAAKVVREGIHVLSEQAESTTPKPKRCRKG